MRELIDFMKKICLINENEKAMVGLSSLNYKPKAVIKKIKPKKNEEIKLSDLMRRK